MSTGQVEFLDYLVTPEIKEIIAAAAARHKYIIAAWVFGSRVSGIRRGPTAQAEGAVGQPPNKNSDLDVAIEIDFSGCSEDSEYILRDWDVRDEFAEVLTSRINCRIKPICLNYRTTGEERQYVRESGLLVYEAHSPTGLS